MSVVIASGCRSEAPRAPTGADTNTTSAALESPAPRSPLVTPDGAQRCAPKELGVRLIGRYDGCAPSGPRSSWSGSGFVARFIGTGLDVVLEGPKVRFSAVVDEATVSEFTTKPGSGTYSVVSGLPYGEHVVSVSRQGEASFGAMVLSAVSVVGGELRPPPAAPSRRLEIVGDSVTAGYGNEGLAPSCPFSAETENHYLTYGAVMARELGAELSTVAWSGKGVVSNYAGNRDEPMPALYDRAVPNDPSSRWTYSWQADAVLLNLGTNDYSTDNDPTDAEFISEYKQLLATLRARYPSAHILCTVGPLLNGADLVKAEANIRTAVENRANAGDTRVAFHAMRVPNTNPGCDWHPGLATHIAMANDLLPTIRKMLGW